MSGQENKTREQLAQKAVVRYGVEELRAQAEEAGRAQQMARDAQAYAQAVVDTVREPLIVLSADLRVMTANRSFYETFRVSPKETENTLLYDLGNRQWDIPRLRQIMEAILPRNVQFQDFAVEHDFPNIGHKTMLLNARQLEQEGKAPMILLAIEDITERRRAEAERENLIKQIAEKEARIRAEQKAAAERQQLLRDVEASRQLFQTVVENAPVGIAVLRAPDFVYELINAAYEAMLPGEPALGRPFAEVHRELASQMLPVFEGVLESGKPYRGIDLPIPVRRSPESPPEEAYFTVGVARIPFTTRCQASSILVLLTDTTEQVRARARVVELAEVAERRASVLETIVEGIADGVFVCDATGRITLVNKGGRELFGIKPGELRMLTDYMKALKLRLPDGTPVRVDELAISRALRGEVERGQEETGIHPRTKRRMDLFISAAPLQEAGRIVGAVAVVSDISRLRELDRLKDEFIAVAAHELKTPIAIMKGYAEALLRRAEQVTPPGRRMLEAIDRGADRITAIVQDLLDVSKLHAGRLPLTMEPIDLPALVTQWTDQVALTTAEHNVRLVKAEPVIVRGDRTRLDQVLANLLLNAVKYSPTGGDIEVAVSVVGNEAVVSVKDHGVGIPKHKQSRIFQRFYSAHTGTPFDYGGIGVGLYISKQIVMRHGGRMWFESVEGKGSTFYFSLPLHR